MLADVRRAHDVRAYWDTGGGISAILPDRYEVFVYRNGDLLCGPFAFDQLLSGPYHKSCLLDFPVPSTPDTYELIVEMEDYGRLRAVQQMPRCVPLDTLIVQSLESDSISSFFSGVIEIRFTDPVGEANFYEITVKDSCKSLVPGDVGVVSLDHKGLVGASTRVILSDDDWDGQQVSLLLGFEERLGSNYSGCDLWLEFISITEDRYRYMKTLTLAYESYNNPFAEPVLIHYNIENGLGLFSAECPFIYELY
ncbi:MAG: DUF4249 family protein [Gammaproteobacteria bacterium]|nr:MAG: DUF4249 family protein [Gammaproteobacteria bacterium]